MSGLFLYLIAALNVVILFGIVKVFREMKRGTFDEAALEEQLQKRGFMNRFFGRITQSITKPQQMYPIGLLFGLGFDTATEVALLVVAGSAGAAGLPWYSILCLPILFAAGMSLLDTIDGSFMNFAYGWAFSQPVRKVFYNLTITGLSVAVAFVIGTIEIVGLLASEVNLPGSFWAWFEGIDINLLGFVIVGMFVATWVIALSVWKFGPHRGPLERPPDPRRGRLRHTERTMTAAPHAPALDFATLEEAVAGLRDRGLRLSTARRLILEALFAAEGPVSALALAQALAIDESSVYPQPRGARDPRRGAPRPPRPRSRPLRAARPRGGRVPLLRALRQGDGARSRAARRGPRGDPPGHRVRDPLHPLRARRGVRELCCR